jgi:hypothetical protein
MADNQEPAVPAPVRTNPITEIVARKIIEIAQTGEPDPTRIKGRGA